MFKRALVLSAGLLSLMLLPHDAEAFWYARGWRGGVIVWGGKRSGGTKTRGKHPGECFLARRQHIEQQYPALPGVDPVIPRISQDRPISRRAVSIARRATRSS